MSISEFKQTFSPFLSQALEEKYQTYRSYTDDRHILAILDHARKLIGTGKCIRPYLAYTMYQACSGSPNSRVLDALVSLELFHTFALIHDDIIDEGTQRHSNLTVHEYVRQSLSSDRYVTNATHHGNAQAILVGDLIFSWALTRFQRFSDLEHHTQAHDIFAHMVDEVAIGQMIDVDTMTRDHLDESAVETKMSLKTASYTFIHPLHIGATLAGFHDEAQSFCRNFGHYLGVAFQTQDDILDLTGNPQDIHKSVLSDLREHQHTLLTEYIHHYGTLEENRRLQSLWGHDANTVSQEDVIALFEQSGALDYARRFVTQYFSYARELCTSSSLLTDDGRENLLALIAYLENRSA